MTATVSYLPSLVISLLFILLTCVLGQAARKLVSTFVNDADTRTLFVEGIAAAENCGCAFEIGIVYYVYGMSTFIIIVLLVKLWWAQVWGDAMGSVCAHVEDVVTGASDWRTAVLLTMAEFVGGIIMCRYVQVYWSLEISAAHVERLNAECKTNIKVPIVFGALVEGSTTFIGSLISKTLRDGNVFWGTTINSICEVSLIMAAFDYTGGFSHPTLATLLQYGCKDETFTEHVTVYWIGPCAGAALSAWIYNHPMRP